MEGKHITVYGSLERVDVKCEMGFTHSILVVARKFIYPTGKTWEMDNGYYTKTMPIYVDAQGREYKKHETIDFSDNIYYSSEGGIFQSYKPTGARVVGSVDT